jgi:rod shape-determining protein MreC
VRTERDNRSGLLFAAALLACGVLTAWHARAARTGHADAASGVVRDLALVPGQGAAASLGRWWHLSAGSLLSAPRLARENDALKGRVLSLSAQNKELLSAQSENVRLRQLLGFEARAARPLLAAQVVALKPNPHTDTITLGCGAAQGVHPHSVVLGPTGALIGQVLDVSPRSCDVLLLTDALSSVGALVHNHTPRGPIGLCQGDGMGSLHVTYLRSDTPLHVGDAVTTSGLGGVFPKALPIGAVASVSVDKARSLQTALLRPAADYDHLEEAFVIQAPPDAPLGLAPPPAASPPAVPASPPPAPASGP